ncbi:MAG: GlcG/HbpS family heme-binding protein, partial [Methylobacter sp.]
MKSLTLEKANLIINAAINKARKLNMEPITVVVLDAAGHLKAMQREDGATVI